MTQTVLILGGNGKIGSHAAAAFGKAGWNVRHYDRSTGNMTTAANGADVIVNGLNPPNYHDWENTIPAITKQVIAAAKASGATVILPGNIYNFGDHSGEINENTPQAPHTRKGKLRVTLEKSYRASGVQTIVLRAGNFIDPNGNGDIMSLLIMRSIRSGKLTTPGNPDAMQAYTYVPDWARAAVDLADMRGQLQNHEDVPFPGHAFTINALKDSLERSTSRSYKISKFPWWLMVLVSPFVEVARELREMRYLYDMSHWIGAEKFNRLLPDFVATDLSTVMNAGLAGQINPDQPMRTSKQAVVAE